MLEFFLMNFFWKPIQGPIMSHHIRPFWSFGDHGQAWLKHIPFIFYVQRNSLVYQGKKFFLFKISTGSPQGYFSKILESLTTKSTSQVTDIHLSPSEYCMFFFKLECPQIVKGPSYFSWEGRRSISLKSSCFIILKFLCSCFLQCGQSVRFVLIIQRQSCLFSFLWNLFNSLWKERGGIFWSGRKWWAIPLQVSLLSLIHRSLSLAWKILWEICFSIFFPVLSQSSLILFKKKIVFLERDIDEGSTNLLSYHYQGPSWVIWLNYGDFWGFFFKLDWSLSKIFSGSSFQKSFKHSLECVWDLFWFFSKSKISCLLKLLFEKIQDTRILWYCEAEAHFLFCSFWYCQKWCWFHN